MAQRFVANSEKLEELTNSLRDTITDIDSYVTEIYNRVNDLGDSWSGDSYDAFKSRCVSFRKKYDDLLDTLETIESETGVIADDSAQLIENVMSTLDVSNISVKGLNY